MIRCVFFEWYVGEYFNRALGKHHSNCLNLVCCSLFGSVISGRLFRLSEIGLGRGDWRNETTC